MKNPSSFRDPSGYVLESADAIYRVIMPPYANEWQALKNSEFWRQAFDRGLINFEILSPENWPEEADNKAIAVLKSPRVPFISYPYEWCFQQLKDAALLTLDLQLLALGHNFTLKDATAYNIQFMDGKAIFIDILSLERLREGKPWDAYGQFCSHFLAPLALMSLRDERLGLLSRLWVDGIPLELTSQLLPLKSKFHMGLNMHLHMHAAMKKKHGETKNAKPVKAGKLSPPQLQDICASLRRTVNGLKSPNQHTEWGDYYNDTNYTDQANREKENFVSQAAAAHPGQLAIDLGANTGKFAKLLAPYFDTVLAADIDHEAVNKHWESNRTKNVLPLVQDLANPSAAIGWNSAERQSFKQRCQANFVMALALIHHLRITAGIPMKQIAQGFVDLLAPKGIILVEFINKNDSQIQRLLRNRDDIFDDYDSNIMISLFQEQGMKLLSSYKISDSARTLFVFNKI